MELEPQRAASLAEEPLFMLTCSAGLELGVAKEVRSKLPSVSIRGPFKAIDGAVRILPRGESWVPTSKGLMFSGEGVLLVDVDDGLDTLTSANLRTICGIYGYLGCACPDPSLDTKQLLRYTRLQVARAPLNWLRGWKQWQRSPYCPAMTANGVTETKDVLAAKNKLSLSAAGLDDTPVSLTDPRLVGEPPIHLGNAEVKCRATVVKQRRKAWPARSMDIAGPIGFGAQLRFGWDVDLHAFHVELFALLGDEHHVMFMGISLQDFSLVNRRNRVAFGNTSLQTYIASSMLWYANIKPGNVVLDPMCGVGTIPIEGATDFSNVTFMGGELDEESLDIATTNLEHARKRCLSPCDLLHWNSIHTRLKSSSVDIILCDMPWGQRSGSQRNNQRIYPKLFKEWSRILCCDGRIYALTISQPMTNRHLARRDLVDKLEVVDCVSVDCGYKVWMYVLRRRPKQTVV